MMGDAINLKRLEIKDLNRSYKSYVGQEVTICGWIKTIRESKSIGFIELNDGGCFKSVQVIIQENKLENYKDVVKQNVGASIIVKGKVIETPDAKQPFEVNADEVIIEGTSSPDYPLQKKRHSLEYLRSISYLRPRTNTFNALYRVRSVAAYALHTFFNERGFVYAHTPIITGSDCEGAGEMFRVTTLDDKNPPLNEDGSVDYSQDFFGKLTSLTVSGQLEGECMALAFGKIYTFGPTFRAENSNTARHAAEFLMIEPEIAFADLNDDMDLAENMIKFAIKYVMEKCPDEIKFFNDFYDKDLIERLNFVANSDFGKVTYTKAIELLEKNKDQFEYPVYWGCDLQYLKNQFLL